MFVIAQHRRPGAPVSCPEPVPLPAGREAIVVRSPRVTVQIISSDLLACLQGCGDGTGSAGSTSISSSLCFE